MNSALLTLGLVLTAAAQSAGGRLIHGRLNDRLVPESGGMARMELKPSTDAALPGVAEHDRVFRATTPQFRPTGAPDGVSVAYVETATGGFLFVDANLDGRLSAAERTPYHAVHDVAVATDVSIPLASRAAGAPAIPFRCRVVTDHWENEVRHYIYFSATFRVEGHADVGGRRTLVSLPFDVARGTVDIRRGKIGIDANGDGTVDLRGIAGPELVFAKGERVILPVNGTYISVESADFASRSLVLREHPAEEYIVIDATIGRRIPDFTFTDFDGRTRRLSDFRGKYVLLDFWGSWCAPCLADIPYMKEAYERFREQGFEILGIDYELNATTEAVRKLLREKDVGWTNATPESVKELVEKRFRIRAFPTFILLDPDGVVVETRSSELGGRSLSSTLERLLRGR